MTKKKPEKGVVRAWAWIINKNYLCPFGNGVTFQYPIFNTRDEAKKWAIEGCGYPEELNKLVRVKIIKEAKRKKS